MLAQGYNLKTVAEAYSELRREDALTATRGLSAVLGKSWPKAKAFAAGVASSLSCRRCEAAAGTLACRRWSCVSAPVGLRSLRTEVDNHTAAELCREVQIAVTTGGIEAYSRCFAPAPRMPPRAVHEGSAIWRRMPSDGPCILGYAFVDAALR